MSETTTMMMLMNFTWMQSTIKSHYSTLIMWFIVSEKRKEKHSICYDKSAEILIIFDCAACDFAWTEQQQQQQQQKIALLQSNKLLPFSVNLHNSKTGPNECMKEMEIHMNERKMKKRNTKHWTKLMFQVKWLPCNRLSNRTDQNSNYEVQDIECLFVHILYI